MNVSNSDDEICVKSGHFFSKLVKMCNKCTPPGFLHLTESFFMCCNEHKILDLALIFERGSLKLGRIHDVKCQRQSYFSSSSWEWMGIPLWKPGLDLLTPHWPSQINMAHTAVCSAAFCRAGSTKKYDGPVELQACAPSNFPLLCLYVAFQIEIVSSNLERTTNRPEHKQLWV